MSWFGGSTHKKGEPNFFPVTAATTGYGELAPEDTTWKCITGKGFQTETHTWYSILSDGSVLMVQVIWSFLGIFLVPATCQMTFKLYNPTTKKHTWKSVNVGGFKHEGHNSHSDSFNIKHSGSATSEEAYHVTAKLDKDVVIDVTFTKPASALGYKEGPGVNGGFSNFGSPDPEKRAAYVVHRFHPFIKSSGQVTVDGVATDVNGEGMFVHAQQSGMRPDNIASRWNFAFFAAHESEIGSVRAIQMEFTTTDAYGPGGANSGRTSVNIGCVYASSLPKSALLAVGQTHIAKGNEPAKPYPVLSKDVVVAEHLNSALDAETGYMAPHGLSFKWEGDRVDGQGQASASVTNQDVMSGLIEKVDVLAEMPKVIRKGLAAVTGTKPFIFQYHNAATLDVTIDGKTIPIQGWMYNEASFVSQ